MPVSIDRGGVGIEDGSEKEDDSGPAEQTEKHAHFRLGHRGRSKKRAADLEMGVVETIEEPTTKPRTSLTLPRASFGRFEQSMPADAVLTKAGADEVCATRRCCVGLVN